MPEVLLAFLERLKDEARATYQTQVDWFVRGKVKDKPTLPDLLRE